MDWFTRTLQESPLMIFTWKSMVSGQDFPTQSIDQIIFNYTILDQLHWMGSFLWFPLKSDPCQSSSTKGRPFAGFCRQVSLLRMRVPPLPQLWVLLAAAKPTAKPPKRHTAKPKTKGAKVVRPESEKKCGEHGSFYGKSWETTWANAWETSVNGAVHGKIPRIPRIFRRVATGKVTPKRRAWSLSKCSGSSFTPWRSPNSPRVRSAPEQCPQAFRGNKAMSLVSLKCGVIAVHVWLIIM